jgi:hypothetical protein
MKSAASLVLCIANLAGCYASECYDEEVTAMLQVGTVRKPRQRTYHRLRIDSTGSALSLMEALSPSSDTVAYGLVALEDCNVAEPDAYGTTNGHICQFDVQVAGSSIGSALASPPQSIAQGDGCFVVERADWAEQATTSTDASERVVYNLPAQCVSDPGAVVLVDASPDVDQSQIDEAVQTSITKMEKSGVSPFLLKKWELPSIFVLMCYADHGVHVQDGCPIKVDDGPLFPPR